MRRERLRPSRLLIFLHATSLLSRFPLLLLHVPSLPQVTLAARHRFYTHHLRCYLDGFLSQIQTVQDGKRTFVEIVSTIDTTEPDLVDTFGKMRYDE